MLQDWHLSFEPSPNLDLGSSHQKNQIVFGKYWIWWSTDHHSLVLTTMFTLYDEQCWLASNWNQFYTVAKEKVQKIKKLICLTFSQAFKKIKKKLVHIIFTGLYSIEFVWSAKLPVTMMSEWDGDDSTQPLLWVLNMLCMRIVTSDCYCQRITMLRKCAKT